MRREAPEAGLRQSLSALTLLAIAASALLPRLAAITLLRHGAIFSDMLTYHERAIRLVRGLPYGDHGRAPFYPYLIACVYRLAGVHATAAYVFQSILEAGAIAFLAFAASRRFGRRAGIAAGLIGSFYPARIVYSGLLLSENAAVILVTLFAGTLLLLEERPSGARAFIAGGLAGMSLLARPPLFLIVGAAVAAIWALSIPVRKRVGLSALALAGFLAAAVPWGWSSRIETGYFVLGDVATGLNLWLGNNPDFHGRYGLPPPVAGFDFSDDYRENARLRREAVAYAVSHPARTVAMWIPKTSYWWSPEHRDLMYLYSNGWIPEVPPVLIWSFYVLVGAGFVLLVPFALRGFFSGVSPARIGCAVGVLAIWGVHLLAFADSRYHMPSLPFLWVFAGIGVARKGRLPAASRAACLALTLLFLVNAAYDLETSASTIESLVRPGGNRTRLGYDLWR